MRIKAACLAAMRSQAPSRPSAATPSDTRTAGRGHCRPVWKRTRPWHGRLRQNDRGGAEEFGQYDIEVWHRGIAPNPSRRK